MSRHSSEQSERRRSKPVLADNILLSLKTGYFFMQQPIVIKVGTNVLTKPSGLLDEEIIKNIVEQICNLKKLGHQVILVTSGAMGAGRQIIKLNKKTTKLDERQILAAAGQVKLLNIYANFFEENKYFTAQVLATKEDFNGREHYLNMKNCFTALLEHNLVPVVNENDVVSVAELMFTDNDELAGLIAAMVNAKTLIILSNIEGLLDDQGKVVSQVDFNTNVKQFITNEKSSFGRGGMATKYKIAERLSSLGIATKIVNGKINGNIIKASADEKVGTTFIPKKNASAIKKWLAHSRGQERGTVYLNACAAGLFTDSKKTLSLLPVGITKLEGEFKKGDVVKIASGAGVGVGYGRAEYGSDVLQKIIGKKNQKEFINYDYLFLEI